jgi:acetyltransferase-like isoleucine patch superfamily enzyme
LALNCLEWVAYLLLLPLLIWSRLPLPQYSSFTAPSQLLSLLPGFSGILLRRVWYRKTLRSCGTNLTVDWLAVIRTRDSEIGDRCTLGVGSWVGWVRIGDDVMTGSHVILISGARQHDFSDTSRPMRELAGGKMQLLVGSDVWVGSRSLLMTHVSSGTVVGAGSVVTKQFEAFAVIVGNPAKILRMRSNSLSK